jgi:foldase protein PrsA
VAKGQQEKALDEAAFKAKKGELTGPVKTQFGFYVFEVTKITKANQQSLEESKESIRAQLQSQKEQDALQKFVEQFEDKYRDQTECGDDYKKGVEAQCGNTKEPKEDAPQQGQPQGAPGQGQAPPPDAQQVPPGAQQVPPQGGGQAPPQQAPPQQGAPPQQAPPQQAPPQQVPPQGAP